MPAHKSKIKCQQNWKCMHLASMKKTFARAQCFQEDSHDHGIAIQQCYIFSLSTMYSALVPRSWFKFGNGGTAVNVQLTVSHVYAWRRQRINMIETSRLQLSYAIPILFDLLYMICQRNCKLWEQVFLEWLSAIFIPLSDWRGRLLAWHYYSTKTTDDRWLWRNML